MGVAGPEARGALLGKGVGVQSLPKLTWQNAREKQSPAPRADF